MFKEVFTIPEAYEVVMERPLDDIKTNSWLLRHKKTGARVALLPCEDDNKVFYIGFRTPPEDSTGVAHIIEHSVLCGSRDFPVKDPFIELVKSEGMEKYESLGMPYQMTEILKSEHFRRDYFQRRIERFAEHFNSRGIHTLVGTREKQ